MGNYDCARQVFLIIQLFLIQILPAGLVNIKIVNIILVNITIVNIMLTNTILANIIIVYSKKYIKSIEIEYLMFHSYVLLSHVF